MISQAHYLGEATSISECMTRTGLIGVTSCERDRACPKDCPIPSIEWSRHDPMNWWTSLKMLHGNWLAKDQTSCAIFG